MSEIFSISFFSTVKDLKRPCFKTLFDLHLVILYFDQNIRFDQIGSSSYI